MCKLVTSDMNKDDEDIWEFLESSVNFDYLFVNIVSIKPNDFKD